MKKRIYSSENEGIFDLALRNNIVTNTENINIDQNIISDIKEERNEIYDIDDI